MMNPTPQLSPETHKGGGKAQECDIAQTRLPLVRVFAEIILPAKIRGIAAFLPALFALLCSLALVFHILNRKIPAGANAARRIRRAQPGFIYIRPAGRVISLLRTK
jgi:hypothetical protein